MIKSIQALTLLLVLALAAPAWAQDVTLLRPGDRIVAYVLDVTDGDSLVVEVRGLRMPVRLAGINCPEWNEDGGKEATAFSEEWFEHGRAVILEAAQDYYSKSPDCWDRYGRLLAFIWRDNRLLQEDMLRAGQAQVKWIKETDSHYQRLLAATKG